jgi:L-iditol 2-dehydrogenase
LVRVGAVGICGSDLHWFDEAGIGDARLSAPLVLGHEMAGTTQGGETPGGQRVAIDPAIPCEACEWCLSGHPNLCQALRFAGHGGQDGGLREYMTWPSRHLHPLPDALSDADGAMLEPLGVALHAVDLGHLQPGMSVGVFGCGPIGLLIIQVARHAGAARVYATDLLPHRLDAAEHFGAEVLPCESGSLREAREILSRTGGRGVDVAFEAAGNDAAVAAAVAAARPGGKVILAGIPDTDSTTFNASTARRKGLTLKLVRRMKHTYPRAIEMVARGDVDVRSLITHRFPLEASAEAFELARRRVGIKVIIEP